MIQARRSFNTVSSFNFVSAREDLKQLLTLATPLGIAIGALLGFAIH
ncbi:MAG: hypothetical protein WC787_04020 [Patescibacteria group bacterium]|jgi:hypothetical protein